MEQLRAAIYAMSHSDDEPEQDLPGMLARLTTFHVPADLAVTVRVEGRPVRLSTAHGQSLFRIASECLFNTAVHAHATRVIIRLAYRPDQVRLSVADDGDGDPEVLRRLASAQHNAPDGYHRGLLNMAARAAEMGGSLHFRAARLGGIRVEVSIPSSVHQEAVNAHSIVRQGLRSILEREVWSVRRPRWPPRWPWSPRPPPTSCCWT